VALVLTIETSGQGLWEMTAQAASVVTDSGVRDGVCVLFVQHTSASLTIQENADPSARHDLEAWFGRTIREDDPAWTHTAEGSDDMPAHVRAMLTDVSLSIPVMDGQLSLGTWQGIYLCEHRRGPHRRRVVGTVLKEG
jgi:secondary thiamine-phosphate synthase enzyme